MRFGLGVTKETVLEWLARAARHAQEIQAHMLRARPVPPGQLDAMWHFLHLTAPAPSKRHKRRIAAYPLLAARGLHERCR